MRFSVEAVFSATDRWSKPLGRMGANMDRFASGMNKRLGQLDRFNDKLIGGFRAVAGATAAMAVPIGLLGADIIRTGAEFEQAITNVGAAWMKTRDQIAPVEQLAMRLGATTSFSATQAANAMELLAKSGFSVEEVMSGVGGVLNAAAASGEDLASTADHISSIMKGMGLSAKDAFGPWESQTQRVADVLAAVSIETKSSIGSLGESMKNVAPVARQLGIPLEDVVMAVGLLQDVGLDASEAGTATATMLTNLAKPADDVAAKMRRMGIAFADSSGNALPLRDILGQFAIAAEKAGGNMDSLAFFADLVGLRGQKAALNLQEMLVSGKFDQLANSMKNVHGYAEKVAGLRQDTLIGDWEKFTGAVDTVKTKIFNLESGPLRNVVKRMTMWVETHEKFITLKAGEWAEKLFTWLDKIANNMPRILEYTEMIGKGLLAWAAFTITAKGIGAAVDAVGFALGGVNVALQTVAAFKAGGVVSALGTIAQALVGVEAKAGAASSALAAGGLLLTPAGLMTAATVVTAGAAYKGYSNMEDSVRNATEGRQGFFEVWGKTLKNRYFDGQMGGADTTIAKLNAEHYARENAKGAADGWMTPAGLGYDAVRPTYGYEGPQVQSRAPEAVPQAETQARLTAQEITRTNNNNTTNHVQLHLPKGASATSRRPTKGITFVPHSGGFVSVPYTR